MRNLQLFLYAMFFLIVVGLLSYCLPIAIIGIKEYLKDALISLFDDHKWYNFLYLVFLTPVILCLIALSYTILSNISYRIVLFFGDKLNLTLNCLNPLKIIHVVIIILGVLFYSYMFFSITYLLYDGFTFIRTSLHLILYLIGIVFLFNLVTRLDDYYTVLDEV